MIYCPRCDKPITPDHRCLSRRHFFGMLAGAAAAILAPPAAPVLRPGDTLVVEFVGVVSLAEVIHAQMEAVRPQLQRVFYMQTMKFPRLAQPVRSPK